MAKTPRKLDADFREDAVRLAREAGKPIAQVAVRISAVRRGKRGVLVPLTTLAVWPFCAVCNQQGVVTVQLVTRLETLCTPLRTTRPAARALAALAGAAALAFVLAAAGCGRSAQPECRSRPRRSRG
jgi:hypothetical protein